MNPVGLVLACTAWTLLWVGIIAFVMLSRYGGKGGGTTPPQRNNQHRAEPNKQSGTRHAKPTHAARTRPRPRTGLH